MPREVIDQFRGRYYFLSNFFMHAFVYQNVLYPSSEHAFQAAKTMDVRIKRKIAKNPSPYMAKRYGHSVVLRPDWEDIKVHIMEDVIACKFLHGALKKKLLATGNSLLIEGNRHGDRFWGACLTGKGMIWEGNGHLWYGRNELGRILMGLREKLSG